MGLYPAVQPLPIIYAIVVLPPITFFCAGVSKRVYPISGISAVFFLFHLLAALENFPVRVVWHILGINSYIARQFGKPTGGLDYEG